MAEQTAVEFLEKQLTLSLGDELKCLRGLFVVAKEMHEQQIKDAYSHGWHDGQDVIISQVKHIEKGGDDAGEKFYNETFKK